MIRRLNKTEWPQFGALLNQGFDVPADTAFFDDFPIWLEQERVTIFADFDEGNLVACAGYRRSKMKDGVGGTLDVGLIGAVATTPAVRGQGRATRLIEAIIEHARGEPDPVAALYLWTSERGIYERLGFRAVGALAYVPGKLFEEWVRASSDQAPNLDVTYGKGWRPELMQALAARPLGLAHTSRDEGWLSRHQNTQWYWAEAEGKIQAYAAVGRGIDMKGIVHEWGVAESRRREILQKLLQIITQEQSRIFVLVGRDILNHYGIKNDAFDPLASRDTLAGVGLRDAVALSFAIDEARAKQIPAWFWGLDAV